MFLTSIEGTATIIREPKHLSSLSFDGLKRNFFPARRLGDVSMKWSGKGPKSFGSAR